MNWLNVYLPDTEEEAVAGAETIDVGIWFRLLAYCGKVENGGRIAGAALWKNCGWIRVVGITLDEFRRDAPGLWKTEGDDVVVFGYPIAQEEKVIANRENGKKGGRPAANKKPHGKPLAPPSGRRERKGKERKVITTDGDDQAETEFGIHPDDLDEYGPAPNSVEPDPDPLWRHFIENRQPFERFDAFRDRYAPNGPPASN